MAWLFTLSRCIRAAISPRKPTQAGLLRPRQSEDCTIKGKSNETRFRVFASAWTSYVRLDHAYTQYLRCYHSICLGSTGNPRAGVDVLLWAKTCAENTLESVRFAGLSRRDGWRVHFMRKPFQASLVGRNPVEGTFRFWKRQSSNQRKAVISGLLTESPSAQTEGMYPKAYLFRI